MDDMQRWELKPILDNLNLAVKNDWEIARQLMYVQSQTHTTKRMKPADIMQFPWDEGYKAKPKMADVKMTKALRQKMIDEMERNKQLLINNHII